MVSRFRSFHIRQDLFQDLFEQIPKVFAALAILFIAAASLLFILSRGDVVLPEVSKVKTTLPKNSFQKDEKAYAAFGEGVFALTYVAPRMHLPDLKSHLTYFGQNGRPDVKMESPLLHFSLEGSKDIVSAKPKEKLFLQYQGGDGMGKYAFSPGNQETSLWIIPGAQDTEATISVGMIDERGNEVSSPNDLAKFQLPEKELARTLQSGWELGKWRVDGTLLARQRARWMGQDKFLERHGGDEYKDRAGKSRIDFGEKDEVYSVYVDAGDILVWKDGHFENAEPSKETQKYPILVVKKVDERLMNLELWDVEGKKKLALNLLKSMETWLPNDIQQEFKFIGARTKSQYVFEVENEKMLLSPHDWLIMTEEGWKKLTTAEEIDEYVDRRMTGTLFVFDGIERRDDQQVMKGLLYNPARTLVQDIELPVQKEGLVYQPLKRSKESVDKSATSIPQPFASSRLENIIKQRTREGSKGPIP